jgi:prephenate dehydrogenase
MTDDLELTGAPTDCVAVIGLGLMGGALCRSLRRLGVPPNILGSDADPIQGELALRAGVIDRFDPDPGQLLADADVVVYAIPLRATLDLMGEHAARWRSNALVTDVVSLKAPLIRAAEARGYTDRFVGAHPICGSEGSGFEAGRPDLFDGARIWLCAGDATPPDLRARAEGFWRAVGGAPSWISAREHDEAMAWVSHLPQLVANALAGALDSAGYRPSDLGPGGRDMTRLAGSNPGLWKDLLEVSAPMVGAGLTSVSHALEVLADLLARREIDRIAEFMERTRRWRREEG